MYQGHNTRRGGIIVDFQLRLITPKRRRGKNILLLRGGLLDALDMMRLELCEEKIRVELRVCILLPKQVLETAFVFIYVMTGEHNLDRLRITSIREGLYKFSRKPDFS